MCDLLLGRFGDRRLEKGGPSCWSVWPSAGRPVRVRALGCARRGEMQLTRLLRNEAVTPGEMIEAAGARAAQRCAGRHVLAIQDTTVIRSTSRAAAAFTCTP